MTQGPITLIPVSGIGEIVPGDDVAGAILAALEAADLAIIDRDVVVVTHKVVSKAEGRLAPIADEAAYRALVLDEAAAGASR